VTALRARSAAAVTIDRVRHADPADVALAWDLAGTASLALRDEDIGVRRMVGRAMRPYSPARGRAGMTVELVRDPTIGRLPAVDILGPATDPVMTLSDGERIHLVVGGRRCSLPDAWRDDPIVFRYEPGFPLSRVMSSVVRPALQVALHRAGATTVHGSAVEVDGGAVLVAGWSETGKTEVALALVESGARFVSDKWSTIAADGRVAAFPIGAGIRRWILPYAPALRSSLPRRGRLQFAAARLAAVVAAPVIALDGRGDAPSLVADVARRAVDLADRLPLGPSDLRHAYGQPDSVRRRAPLTAIVLLRAVGARRPPALAPMSAARAVERLVRSAAFERRPFVALAERSSYAFPDESTWPADWAADWAAEERARLRAIVASVPVYELTQPFPADPRPAAALIRRHLS
jgi:hypothetical protein